jgi:AcrR family transcriptional regulator
MARAARELFLRQGYVATRMTDIAEAAGVSAETLYTAFGPKPRLVQFLIETSLSRENEPVPSLAREWVRRARAEPDPRYVIEMFAAGATALQERVAGMWAIASDAAKEDPALAAIMVELTQRRRRDMRVFIDDIAGKGGLREDISAGAAADAVWALNSPEFYSLLVAEGGWTPAEFQGWFADACKRLLLP